MMQETTILTAAEAITYGPGDGHLSGAGLSIRPTEEALFNDRFGWSFYETLRADRYNYALRPNGSTVNDDGSGNRFYTYWNESRTDLVVGEFVLARDVIYKVIRDVDAARIPPSNLDYYQVADRFQTECYESLYRNYLRSILALAVARAGVFGRSYQETNRGAVKQYEEGKSKPLSTAEIAALKSEMSGDLERSIKNMERHIRRSTTKCFAKYGRLETSGETCGETGDLHLTKPARTRRKNYGFIIPNVVR